MNVANADINDGVHPTANGYKVIATAVYQALSITEPAVTRIVCFGDSITYGYKMEGQGTVEGDPYPAVLNRMFNNW
jgi:lysophospholipase L1-like esterase